LETHILSQAESPRLELRSPPAMPSRKTPRDVAEEGLRAALAAGEEVLASWLEEMGETGGGETRALQQHVRTGKMTEKRVYKLQERGGCSADTLSTLTRMQKRMRQVLQRMRQHRETLLQNSKDAEAPIVQASREFYARVQQLGIEKRLRLGAFTQLEDAGSSLERRLDDGPALVEEQGRYRSAVEAAARKLEIDYAVGAECLGASLLEDFDKLVETASSLPPKRVRDATERVRVMRAEVEGVAQDCPDSLLEVFSAHMDRIETWGTALARKEAAATPEPSLPGPPEESSVGAAGGSSKTAPNLAPPLREVLPPARNRWLCEGPPPQVVASGGPCLAPPPATAPPPAPDLVEDQHASGPEPADLEPAVESAPTLPLGLAVGAQAGDVLAPADGKEHVLYALQCHFSGWGASGYVQIAWGEQVLLLGAGPAPGNLLWMRQLSTGADVLLPGEVLFPMSLFCPVQMPQGSCVRVSVPYTRPSWETSAPGACPPLRLRVGDSVILWESITPGMSCVLLHEEPLGTAGVCPVRVPLSVLQLPQT